MLKWLQIAGKRTVWRVICAILVIAAVGPAAGAGLRGVALVIGQSKYDQLPVLANPTKDARDVDRLLGDLGFEVNRVLNADSEELRAAVKRFEADAADADVALIYYSGHGIEAKGQNFIAPTDTDLTSPETAGASLVAVQPILEAVGKVAPVTIVLLDACRSDPFPPGQEVLLPGDTAPTPVTSQGLAPLRGPAPVKVAAAPDGFGTVIGFAAEPGQPALDGAPGENSPYAAALLKHFAAGGYAFGDVMTMVTEEVYLKTHARQLPWTNSSLRRVLSFTEAPEAGDADREAITTERRKLLLSIATTPEPTQRYIESLAGEQKVPLDALYGMLNVLGIQTTDAGGDLEQQLRTGAERLKELLADRSTTVKSDPELERLSRLAADAENEGAIALALTYRTEASARADALLASRQSEAGRLRQDMIDIASTYADNAATAVLNFDHAQAAALYAKAVAAVADWDKDKALDYLIKQGDALTDRGYYTTDNAALNDALAVYQQALAQSPQAAMPARWAMLQDRIGQTMQVLGERLESDATLRESIDHYRAALTVRTEADDREGWAKTQNNLGNALFTLGGRTRDIEVLKQSAPAFEAALTVIRPDEAPIGWATVANNQAATQVEIAQQTYALSDGAEMTALLQGNADPSSVPEVKAAREAATALLDTAVNMTETALAAVDRTSNPLGWALLAHTRATALQERGEIGHSVADLTAAVEGYRDVLTVHTRQQMPAQWARSSNNLAVTLKKLSDETSDPVPLREAIAVYRDIIAATPRESVPLDWADRQESLGNALAMLSQYDKTPEPLVEALAAYDKASEVTTLARGTGKWKQLQISISTSLLMKGLMTQDRASVEAAKARAIAAREALATAGDTELGFFDAYLPQVDQVLALLPK